MTTASPAVLIVDDDPFFRELVGLYAEGEGLEPLGAHDGAAGVARLQSAGERVALVLLDYWMPNTDPAECARRMASLVRPPARIVLVTAAIDPGQRAAEVGLSAWMGKPIDAELLRKTLREARAAFDR